MDPGVNQSTPARAAQILASAIEVVFRPHNARVRANGIAASIASIIAGSALFLGEPASGRIPAALITLIAVILVLAASVRVHRRCKLVISASDCTYVGFAATKVQPLDRAQVVRLTVSGASASAGPAKRWCLVDKSGGVSISLWEPTWNIPEIQQACGARGIPERHEVVLTARDAASVYPGSLPYVLVHPYRFATMVVASVLIVALAIALA